MKACFLKQLHFSYFTIYISKMVNFFCKKVKVGSENFKVVVMAERSLAPDWELRSKVVGSIPGYTSKFWTVDCKKINKALSVRLIVICSDHKLLCWDSYKGELPESIYCTRLLLLFRATRIQRINDYLLLQTSSDQQLYYIWSWNAKERVVEFCLKRLS